MLYSVLSLYSLDLVRFSAIVPYEHLYTYSCYVHDHYSSVAMYMDSVIPCTYTYEHHEECRILKE